MFQEGYHSLISINPESIRWFPTIGLKLTGACALKCAFCCEPERLSKVASLDSMKAIADKLWEAGTRRLCLTGGDPLLYPKLDELTQYTKLKGFYNLLLTADGSLLLKKLPSIHNSINGIRLSVHGVGTEHDLVVGRNGVFSDIESSIGLIREYDIELFVSTVITSQNLSSISAIVEWCIKMGVKKYYLYGLVKSGLGDNYIKENGMPSFEEFHELVTNLNKQFSEEKIEIKFYDYSQNAECILVYGSGNIIIDPYFDSPAFQLLIGNVLLDKPSSIWSSFNKDYTNVKGYKRHLQNAI